MFINGDTLSSAYRCIFLAWYSNVLFNKHVKLAYESVKHAC